MSNEDTLRRALEDAEAFIAIMFGEGPDAIIPETVDCPIGVPIKIGELMRAVREALAATQEPAHFDGEAALAEFEK